MDRRLACRAKLCKTLKRDAVWRVVLPFAKPAVAPITISNIAMGTDGTIARGTACRRPNAGSKVQRKGRFTMAIKHIAFATTLLAPPRSRMTCPTRSTGSLTGYCALPPVGLCSDATAAKVRKIRTADADWSTRVSSKTPQEISDCVTSKPKTIGSKFTPRNATGWPEAPISRLSSGGWCAGLHQRHINLRLHISRRSCRSIRANSDACKGENRAGSKACRVSNWFY